MASPAEKINGGNKVSPLSKAFGMIRQADNLTKNGLVILSTSNNSEKVVI